MSMLYLNKVANEINKQAAAPHIPGDMTARMLHPTLWGSNPYAGLMMAGGGLGAASGLLSADDDDNKIMRGLAGAGLGLAGTSALNNMGAFDDSIANATKIRGGKVQSTAAGQTKSENEPRGEQKPNGESTPKAPKAGSVEAQLKQMQDDMTHVSPSGRRLVADASARARAANDLINAQAQIGAANRAQSELAGQLAKAQLTQKQISSMVPGLMGSAGMPWHQRAMYRLGGLFGRR